MDNKHHVYIQSESDSEDDYDEFSSSYTPKKTCVKKTQVIKMSLFKFDSFQSTDTDTSLSTVGSVSELLQYREIDAKSLLKDIFGPSTKKRRQISVPDRFLTSSQCDGISVPKFIEHEIKLQIIRECTSSGFRGLLEAAEARQHPALTKLVDMLCSGITEKLKYNSSTVWSLQDG